MAKTFSLKQYLPYILGAVLLYAFWPLVATFFGRFIARLTKPLGAVGAASNQAKVEEEIKQNPANYQQTNGTQIDVGQLDHDARAIYDALGLDSPWWNPTGWIEDEAAIMNLLKPYTVNTFALLSSRYSAIYARQLDSDLTEYLSADELTKVRYLWA